VLGDIVNALEKAAIRKFYAPESIPGVYLCPVWRTYSLQRLITAVKAAVGSGGIAY